MERPRDADLLDPDVRRTARRVWDRRGEVDRRVLGRRDWALRRFELRPRAMVRP